MNESDWNQSGDPGLEGEIIEYAREAILPQYIRDVAAIHRMAAERGACDLGDNTQNKSEEAK